MNPAPQAVASDPFNLVITCVIGSVGLVYDRPGNKLTIRRVSQDSGGRLHGVGRYRDRSDPKHE